MPDVLTARQSQILGILRLAVLANGYPPSVREIAEACNCATSSVFSQLRELEDKGYIVRDPNKPRALTIVGDVSEGAAALIAAADAIKDVRENGLPDGCDSHPIAEGFERWLRHRAGVA